MNSNSSKYTVAIRSVHEWSYQEFRLRGHCRDTLGSKLATKEEETEPFMWLFTNLSH